MRALLILNPKPIITLVAISSFNTVAASELKLFQNPVLSSSPSTCKPLDANNGDLTHHLQSGPGARMPGGRFYNVQGGPLISTPLDFNTLTLATFFATLVTMAAGRCDS